MKRHFWLGFLVCYLVAGLGQAITLADYDEQAAVSVKPFGYVFATVAWPVVDFVPTRWWGKTVAPYIFEFEVA